jgi:hypothetical protein
MNHLKPISENSVTLVLAIRFEDTVGDTVLSIGAHTTTATDHSHSHSSYYCM